MPSTYNLSGHLYNNAGVPIAGAKVNLFKKNTTTSAGGSSATTDTAGYYTISPGSTLSEQAQVDVRVTNAATGAVRRIKYDDVTAQKAVVVRNVHLSPDSNQVNSSGGFHTTLAATALQGASHTVTFPMLTGGALVTATPQSSAGAITLSSAEAVVSSGAITGTALRGTTSLQLATGATVTGIDDGTIGTSSTLLATQGAIKTYVDAQIDTEDTIAELNDTNISSPAAGHLLVYDNTASVWDNVALSGGDGLTATLGDGTLALALDLKSNGGAVIESNELAVDLGASSITGTLAVGDGGTGATTLNNLITLTTHTTGNYVATVTAGTGLTSSGATSGEGIAHSLSVDASQGQITTVGDLATGSIADGFGTINNGSNTITTTGLVTAGSLTVNGTTTLNGALVLGDAAADTLDITASATVSTDFKFADDIDIALGSNADILMRNRSTSAAANLEITDIILGTSVHPGVAANSLLVSNITASGDIMFVTNRGGNSEAHMLFDASAGDTFLYARGVEAMKIEGGGAVTVTPALTVTGALTLGTVAAAGTDTDKFLVLDSGGNVDYRTGAQVLSDIGAAGSKTYGIANDNAVEIDGADIADDEYARFTANGLESRTAAEVAADIEGSIDAVGTIASGTWQGTAIASAYIAADAITGAKIADDAIDSDHIAAGAIDNAHLADDAVDSDELAAGAVDLAHMSSESVDEDNLHISNSGSNGQFLSKQSGNSGGLTWATPSATATALDDVATGDAASTLATSAGNITIDAQGNDTDIIFKGTDNTSDITMLTLDGSEAGKALFNGDVSVGTSLLTATIDYTDGDLAMTIADGGGVTFAQDVTMAALKTITLGDEGQVRFSDDLPAADDSATGIVYTMTALTGIAIGDLVHMDANGKLDEAHADATADMPAIGIALTANASGSDAEIDVLLHGIYKDTGAFDFTPGLAVYVSDGTEGLFTQTAPTSTGDFVQRVGVALTADTILFNPSVDVIEHA